MSLCINCIFYTFSRVRISGLRKAHTISRVHTMGSRICSVSIFRGTFYW